jgi:Spy/CpxP family protein refolding chaperone
MLKISVLAGSLLVLGLVVLAGGVYAATSGDPGRSGKLDLTQPQIQELHALWRQSRQEAQGRRAGLRAKRAELRDLLRAGQVDQAAIDQKVQEIAELQTAALKARVAAQIARRKVLGPDQQQGQLRRRRFRGDPARQDPQSLGGSTTPQNEEASPALTENAAR